MLKHLKYYLTLEPIGGIFLLITTLFSMLLANSSYSISFPDHLVFITNDGLMTFFFLLIGLELKRGYQQGQFAHRSHWLFPLLAAFGGMLVPALIYAIINHANPTGWAIPVATDIAFALGVLSLFGQRVPTALKLFLLTLAIFDDIGAICIITLFYTQHVDLIWLCFALLLLTILYILNRYGVRILSLYLLLGAGLWYCLLYGGIHPTLSGVLIAFLLPYDASLENRLHPWVVFCIMPIFAFVNAGFSLHTISLHSLTNLVVLGIALGLFIGKQIGIFGFSWLLVHCRLVKLPEKIPWLAFYGIALLCGIGFTMSLFLGTLSFANNDFNLEHMRLGVMLGSLASSLLGALILKIALKK